MDLTNERVMHGTFGAGRVQSVQNGRIVVDFAEEVGQKTFQYPLVFEHHMTLCEAGAQQYAHQELDNVLAQQTAERVERGRHFQEEQDRHRADRLAARKPVRKTPVRKSAKAKASVTPEDEEAE